MRQEDCEIGDRLYYTDGDSRSKATVVGFTDDGWARIDFDKKSWTQDWNTARLKGIKGRTLVHLKPKPKVPDVPLGKWGTLL